MIRLLIMALLVLSGCAGVVSIQHPMIVTNHTCEFNIARPGYWPWQPSICLTACRDDKELVYFAGCSTDGGLVSGIKELSGLTPTLPVVP